MPNLFISVITPYLGDAVFLAIAEQLAARMIQTAQRHVTVN
jgi:hypothetical protein